MFRGRGYGPGFGAGRGGVWRRRLRARWWLWERLALLRWLAPYVEGSLADPRRRVRRFARLMRANT